jgi:uncharacterized protein YkwD
MRTILKIMTTLLLVTACKDKSDDPIASQAKDETQAQNGLLTTCYQGDSWSCAVEAEIVNRVNLLRADRPLTQHFESSFVARTWSQAQANQGQLSHTGFPQQRQQVLASEFPQLKFRYLAENVGMSSLTSEDPARVAERIVGLWEQSAGHRANMLASYSFIGVGVFRKGGQFYATQLFYN